MKKGLVNLLLVAMVLLTASGAWAYTATIDDASGGVNTFYGGTVVNGPYNDVIGVNRFEVDSMKVDIVGTKMTITLQGLYFTNLNGTTDTNLKLYGKPGDLYINKDGWSSALGTAPHYAADKFTLGEGWDYVVGAPTGAGFGVYALQNTFTDTGSSGGHWGGYRTDQAWTGGFFGTAVTGATMNTSGDTMTYTIDDITSLGLASTIGFHWTMECGNDVVEGSVSMVPEPASMLLLGLGLVGLFGVARRRMK